ncbi:MAG: hypothetical protein ACJAZS_000243 [Alteromonas naphthalenivorans]|jgi:hypothetical protein
MKQLLKLLSIGLLLSTACYAAESSDDEQSAQFNTIFNEQKEQSNCNRQDLVFCSIGGVSIDPARMQDEKLRSQAVTNAARGIPMSDLDEETCYDRLVVAAKVWIIRPVERSLSSFGDTLGGGVEEESKKED